MVKLSRMEKYFPNRPLDYNIIYSVSNCVPSDICRTAKAKGVKVVCHINSVFHPAYRTDYEKRNAPTVEIYKLADHIVFGSRFAMTGAERYLGSVAAPFTIIYNAVDTNHFRPQVPCNSERFNVIATGAHYIQHRLVPLIQAMPHILQKYPQARLIIAGPLIDGHGIFDCGHETIHRVINEVGLKQVEFLDRYTQEDAPGIYAKGDVLVHLKHMDWTPNTVIEAMTCGLPVVHTGNGGLPELVGEAGISLNLPFNWEEIKVAKPVAVAEACIEAYEQRHVLGKRARQMALDCYEMTTWVNAHRQIFNNLLCQ